MTTLEFSHDAVSALEADWLVVFVTQNHGPSAIETELDEKLGGQLSRLRESDDLTGKLGETLMVHDVPGLQTQRLILAGLGEPGKLNLLRLEKAAMTVARSISAKRDVTVAVTLPGDHVGDVNPEQFAQTVATSLVVGSVGQAFHKAEIKRHPFSEIIFRLASKSPTVQESINQGVILGDAMNITRRLVNLPPQEIYPESFAEEAQARAEDLGLECTILDEDDLDQEQMNSLLAVAIGSDRPARMAILKYRGAGDNAPTLALCGKGVTFDSGGLSLKNTENMLTMKCDMAGAATVLGAMTAIARLELPVNVTGYMGLVENMPSGAAFKLGDILTARNGVTIEVGNTDAEGRLVLADVLSYAIDQGADKLIDLATLTGACVVALGEEVTGLFANNQDWADSVLEAAKHSGERIWQLPMDDIFNELIESDVADVKNTGGRWGGAISAAKFLEKFVSDKPWVHLDIAGPAFATCNKAHREGGGTGCMVRTLVEIAAGFGGN